ncbi:MAG: tetratricopeptide repeat protein [Calditrichaeota bacterium]|nr:tetratricopeptide repeat protein [Calditrichota bacterium]
MIKKVLVLSADLVKWNTDRRVANIAVNLHHDENNFSVDLDINLNDQDKLVDQTLEAIENGSKGILKLKEKDKVEIRDLDMIRNGLQTFYEKMIRGLLQNKNGKSRNKKAVTRYNLFYLKEPEIDLLSDDEKYHAYMDIINRKAAKDQYSQVGNYIQEAIALRKDDTQLIYYMAKYLMDNRNYKEALGYFEEFLKADPDNLDSLLTVAKLCDKTRDYKKANSYYDRILKIEPMNLNALIRKAQLKYYQRQDFMPDLEKIAEIDSEWLKDYLRSQWDYHLPEEKQDLNPIKAARYLGLENSRELINLAFRKEVPSYYEEKESRVMFSKDEIDFWHQIVKKFYINEFQIELYADALN